MTREEIEQTKSGILTDFSNSPNLLVSFGGIQQGLGIPVFEFFNSISDLNCDKIFCRDFQQAWYQKGVDSELDSLNKVIEYLNDSISKNQYEKICFIGNSMGGYAAILFGTILNVDRVISFAPQSYINWWNRLLYGDTRWKTQISKIYKFDEKRREYFDLKSHLKRKKGYKTDINIFYSPNHKHDKMHAERLKNNLNVKLFAINEGGHGVVRTVRNNGKLRRLIASTFDINE